MGLTNVGDIYAHALLSNYSNSAVVKTTKTGQRRIPVPDESYHHDNTQNKSNKSNYYLYYTLSNKEPIPYHARYKYYINNNNKKKKKKKRKSKKKNNEYDEYY